MPQNTTALSFSHTDTTGQHFDTFIPSGFAEIGQDGLILSFVIRVPENPYGEMFILDERANPTEERVRRIATWVGSAAATWFEGRMYRERTGESLNAYMRVGLSGVNQGIANWANNRLPYLTNPELGYFDRKGRLRFSGELYAR